MYMNQGNMVQIEAPEFDPDIDGDNPLSTNEKPNQVLIQGTLPTIPEVTKPEPVEVTKPEPEDDNSPTPEPDTQQPIFQETNWPDTIPIPRVSSLAAQPEEQNHNRCQARYYTENFEIPELEKNSEEEQFANLDSYLAHHNTYQASEYIQQEYHTHLHDLDNYQYHAKIDRADLS